MQNKIYKCNNLCKNKYIACEKYESYEEWKQSAIKWKEAIEKDC